VAPTDCTGGTQLGSPVTASADGTYHPTVGLPTPSAGTYWWYATWPGDSNNSAASTACAPVAKTVVSDPDVFQVAVPDPEFAGTAFTATITAKLAAGGTDTGYTGSQTITFTGPANAPDGTAPSYPATVTFTNGVGTASITLYNAVATTLTATQGPITGSSSFTVKAGTASQFRFTNCSANGGPAVNPCPATVNVGGRNNYVDLHVTVLDAWQNVATVSGGNLVVALNITGNKFSGPASVTITNGTSESGAARIIHTGNGNNDSTTVSTTNAGFTQATITVAN
jgi:hypothetical protein